ncbi:MAG TPA: mannonate dehydratase [Capsulimonadaceae bacterium]|jgi:mannonate dehydratase
MKLGLGLYKHMLDSDHFRFARQCGCTHIVAHLVDYFNHGDHTEIDNQPVGGRDGWGYAGDPEKLWSAQELTALRKAVNDEGLELEAIENFDPAFWHDILLDGPLKSIQIENVKTIIQNVGKAGIPVFGYNFSIAGVGGRIEGPWARGGAVSVGMDEADQTPMPAGMVWNMVYDRNTAPGTISSATHEQLWQRLSRFLDEILPVAEEAGVRMALHPDDPPVATLRSQPRLVYKPDLYQRVIDINPSPANALEFCVGTIAEMQEGDVYEAVDSYSRQGRLGYVHLRNIAGKAPVYRETFIDDGDVDILRVMRILKDNDFNGVLIPDHTPQMTCGAPWHAGMAYALGFMRAAIMQMEGAG